MGGYGLSKILKLKRAATSEEDSADKQKRAPAPRSGGGKRRKLNAQLTDESGKHLQVKKPVEEAQDTGNVEFGQRIGEVSAYESLIGELSTSYKLLKHRKLQEEGLSESSESDNSAEDSEDDCDGEELQKEGSDLMNKDGSERQGGDGAFRSVPSLTQNTGASHVLDSWTRKGYKAAMAAAVGGNFVPDQAQKIQQKPQEMRKMEDVSSDALAAGVNNTWAQHVERELAEDHNSNTCSGASTSKLIKAPESSEFKDGAPKHATWQMRHRSTLPPAPATLFESGVKERLQARWLEVHLEDSIRFNSPLGSSKKGHDEGVTETCGNHHNVSTQFTSPLQRAFFAALNSYADVLLPCRPYPVSMDEPDEHMDAYLLHVLNHVNKTADRIKKNNEKIEAAENAAKAAVKGAATASDPLPRDQGFTRPKVLILLPQRNLAFKLIRRLVSMAMRETRADSVQGKEKFVEQFTDPEEEEEEDMDPKLRARRAAKPAEWQALFSGNVDDHFRVGIKITRGAIRLFSDLFQSDVIVASPIALATKLAEENNGRGDAALKMSSDVDFLSSIELLIIDRADMMCMQNWTHVETTVEALNKLPREQHGTDIMRVREWYLAGMAKRYRQTVLLSSFLNSDMNRLMTTSCHNFEGHIRLVPEHPGVLSAVIPQVQQLFQRFSCSTPSEAPSARFDFFKRSIWPRMKESGSDGQLIFIPHYFDFVRIRNFLAQEEADFACICEYTAPPDVTAARSRFFHRQRRILLYTERAHFYHRHRLRGIKDVLFFSSPEHGNFYSEILNLLETENHSIASATGSAHATVAALFCKYDMMQLERVVGSNRARKMVAGSSDSSTFMFC
ncbi:hypothetical protein CEUSTIGMA_g10494.t1 [Chlamydomonas eustigma]|uniref:U3 small nucleolar RNA-associated protein 25 n=1 Tax=Chlamydomonas eustigma TaxID=1157962 RepID=A0A250XJ16_9CHLO|nr:hypothetical protein CEUSTIGMA_g10494.t1 [Chlamydomonas eustigma]|eukprot:GAX83068.1 hypothetical protein CEUSTIGMA_g10494.t1 [Chlamydomonas eustigma]